MEREATINIVALRHNDDIVYKTDFSGGMGLIMGGLTNAIKRLEEELPEDLRGQYRADILELLNDRH